MDIINRSAITINYKQPFVDWTNGLTPEIQMSDQVAQEATTYLVKGDFDDADKYIKKYYKKIFEEELEGHWTDEEDWPKKRTFKLFNEWFSYGVSELVIDL
ncbi:hypothetical protein [Flavobacterium sp. 7A]|uniref:hypothetical protein n=1 Tax=Flavobacterium sp. 7A TaxID=2940571 RepID=UPI0022260031|nr:hypothetical protein [Flavobacterium sp. 7A]MCW2120841.1 hypothetical protein [Flavobacterium sp. 7A]